MQWRATIPKRMLLVVALSSCLWAQQEVQPPSTPAAGQAQQSPPAASAPNRNEKRPDNNKPRDDKDSDSHSLPAGEDPENRLLTPLLKHLASDQLTFWTAPVHFRTRDLQWGLPFVGITAGFIASDSWMSKQIPANHIARSKSISNYAVYSLIGVTGGAYALGHLTHNDHLGEAGLLGGEAAVNSTVVDYIFKAITQRPRPYQGDGNGTFFQGGTSFASEHTAVAWSAASVWAHEYPGTLSQLLAYGLASAVTVTRVTGKQHFPSDAVVGSALGWYFGRQVYRAHHDPELGGAPWGGLLPDKTGEKRRNPANMGSPYVPLDSWIYPALERLIALGYIGGGHLGMRPWTRMECARLVEEAGDSLQGDQGGNKAEQDLYDALVTEFADETRRRDGASNLGANLDSLYTRVTGISGQPLSDGYHFGQTITNDYGRPFGNGYSDMTGLNAYAVAGPLSVSVQGEYQHAPAISSDPPSVLQAMAAADFTSPVSNARAEVNRFLLLDSTVAVTFRNTQFSFGKQSQWMGPGESGPLLFSNNAEPVLMFKIDSVSPYRIPLLSRVLGPIRTEYFLGQLVGHQFELNGSQLLGPGNISPQPFLDGAKISFKPTENLEVGMGFTAQFAGPGLPFTLHNFLRTFFSHTSGDTAGSGNPGKRISAADFTYRIPGLRNWLTLYLDSLVVDEFSPIGSTRANVNPGIYLPRIPKVPGLEFRAEGVHESTTREFEPGFVYYGFRRYRSGYTNNGNLLASWIGRAGEGGQAWLTYSFSPRTKMQLGYRRQEVSPKFLGGGHLTDYSVHAEALVFSQVAVSGTVQYEPWSFPLLSSRPESNFMASVQLTYRPRWRISK